VPRELKRNKQRNVSNVDDTFKNALEGYTELPNPELWEGISAAVDAERARVTAPAQKRGLVVVWRKTLLAVASVAAVIALVWTVGLAPSTSYDPRELQKTIESGEDLSTEGGVWSPVEALLEAQEIQKTVLDEVLKAGTEESGIKAPGTVAVHERKKRVMAPHWEARLAEYEAEMAVNETLLALDVVRSELVQEPVKVEVNFTPTENAFYAEAPAGILSKTLGGGAKALGQNVAKIIGKGYLNWESAKVSVNQTLATLSTKRTSKNN
jgi:hypothetical protein